MSETSQALPEHWAHANGRANETLCFSRKVIIYTPLATKSALVQITHRLRSHIDGSPTYTSRKALAAHQMTSETVLSMLSPEAMACLLGFAPLLS